MRLLTYSIGMLYPDLASILPGILVIHGAAVEWFENSDMVAACLLGFDYQIRALIARKTSVWTYVLVPLAWEYKHPEPGSCSQHP